MTDKELIESQKKDIKIIKLQKQVQRLKKEIDDIFDEFCKKFN